MTRRGVPYPGAGCPIIVPVEIWHHTLEAVRSYAPLRSEALVFWGGVVAGDSLQVTGLLLPNHQPQGGCVRLTEAESRWVLRTLHHRDEKLIAQVHSHPGDAFHSWGDDQGAASFHPGYVSVVVPRLGWQVNTLQECEVLEFDSGTFSALSHADIDRRIRISPLVQERSDPIRIVEGERSWLSSIASSLRRKLTGLKRR